MPPSAFIWYTLPGSQPAAIKSPSLQSVQSALSVSVKLKSLCVHPAVTYWSSPHLAHGLQSSPMKPFLHSEQTLSNWVVHCSLWYLQFHTGSQRRQRRSEK